ncbi:unnamed protein product, partial [Symbiodinium microadriaticum]
GGLLLGTGPLQHRGDGSRSFAVELQVLSPCERLDIGVTAKAPHEHWGSGNLARRARPQVAFAEDLLSCWIVESSGLLVGSHAGLRIRDERWNARSLLAGDLLRLTVTEAGEIVLDVNGNPRAQWRAQIPTETPIFPVVDLFEGAPVIRLCIPSVQVLMLRQLVEDIPEPEEESRSSIHVEHGSGIDEWFSSFRAQVDIDRLRIHHYNYDQYLNGDHHQHYEVLLATLVLTAAFILVVPAEEAFKRALLDGNREKILVLANAELLKEHGALELALIMRPQDHKVPPTNVAGLMQLAKRTARNTAPWLRGLMELASWWFVLETSATMSSIGGEQGDHVEMLLQKSWDEQRTASTTAGDRSYREQADTASDACPNNPGPAEADCCRSSPWPNFISLTLVFG